MLGRASRYAGHGGLKILVGVVTVVAYILDALHQIVEARHLMQERGASPKMGRSRYSAQRLNSRYFSLPSFPTPVISPAPSVCRYRWPGGSARPRKNAYETGYHFLNFLSDFR